MDISNLTEEQQEELQKQLDAKKTERERKRRQELASYNELVDSTVADIFKASSVINKKMSSLKTFAYKQANALIQLKNELFSVEEQSNEITLRNGDNTLMVKLGTNEVDKFQDTYTAGVQKIDNWLDDNAKDGDPSIVKLLKVFIGDNKRGKLKLQQVVKVGKLAEEIESPELIEASKIIRDSHFTAKSSSYMRVYYKDGHDVWQPLALNFTDIRQDYNDLVFRSKE